MNKNKYFIIIIFLVFISLGIPDGMFGSGWPYIKDYYQLNSASISYITLGIFIASFISSLTYPVLKNKFKLSTIIITSISFIIIGMMLFISHNQQYSLFPSILFLGLGAGCIDVAINDYVAQNYGAKILSWLHGAWGIGISSGAALVGLVLSLNRIYTDAFVVAAITLFIIALIVYYYRDSFNLKVTSVENSDVRPTKFKLSYLLGPLFYFFYGVEYVMGIFYSTYLVEVYSLAANLAAYYVALYWIGLTIGRFLTGLYAHKINNFTLLFIHLNITIIGCIALIAGNYIVIGIGGLLIGFGFSCLYPLMMVLPFNHLSNDNASKVLAYQVAGAMLGVIVLPLLYGYIFNNILSYNILPFTIMLSMFMMIFILYLIKLIYQENKYLE